MDSSTRSTGYTVYTMDSSTRSTGYTVYTMDSSTRSTGYTVYTMDSSTRSTGYTVYIMDSSLGLLDILFILWTAVLSLLLYFATSSTNVVPVISKAASNSPVKYVLNGEY